MKIPAKLSPFLVPLSICFLLFGCEKTPPAFPTTPAILFKSYNVEKLLDTSGNTDYKLTLTISFTDGDGDIGLGEQDTTGPFAPDQPHYYNLFVNYYEKVGGQFIPMTVNYPFGGDTIKYNGRIPVITPAGRNKAIKGDIEYSIDLGKGSKTGNSIKFDFVLYDRALHRSNVTESYEIALP
jgi:hypothetical protein